MIRRGTLLAIAAVVLSAAMSEGSVQGYYRHPAIHGDTVVFVAEGDLWRVSAQGGRASRLTTHPEGEWDPVISPDGKTLAFTAAYEGPREVYTMPLDGGLPVRRTWSGDRCSVEGFAPDGRLLYSTRAHAALPDYQLALLDLESGALERVPLHQAAQGAFDASGETLFFTRYRKQGSHTKRYQGGTAENLWRFRMAGGGEAEPLTADYAGTSSGPMAWEGRVYFASDRDGFMNLWSMLPDGSDPRQHTRHAEWDVKDPALSDGRIVYQLGADLRLHDIASGEDREIPITLDSDFDQTREKWITQPFDWLTSAHPSPDGDRVVLTARGEVFVAPHGQGRLVRVTRRPDVRYRQARFNHDGTAVIALSDESGEVEFWRLPANGVGEAEQLTGDGRILRWDGLVSPDGKHLAHHDKNQELWIYSFESGSSRRIDTCPYGGFQSFADLAWSPDSRWLAYVTTVENLHRQIRLYDLERDRILRATTDRYDSTSPAWSPDGRWLYFLSDRHLDTLVESPWGPRQPDPFYDRTTEIYHLALVGGLPSPFAPETELTVEPKGTEKDGDDAEEPVEVAIEADGLAARLTRVPVEAGNYSGLTVTGDRLIWFARPDLHEDEYVVMSAKIARKDVKAETLVEGARSYELTADRKKLMVRTKDAVHLVDAGASAPAKLDDATRVDLSGWAFPLVPRREWRQMFVEAWRLERDYFYDPGMHGVDWPAMLEKYLPLVDRVSERGEFSDLVAQMVSELSALHIYVYGGDFREGPESVGTAGLGAMLQRDAGAGGHRIETLYVADPDRPELRSPLIEPGVELEPGDVILAVNGVPALEASDLGELLRHQVGRQTLLRVRDGREERDVVVVPLSSDDEAELRYRSWEYSRRLETERLGNGRLGYVHLRAMGGDDIDRWTREFWPVFRREGLVIDVRHNRGGNIDSWILGKLLKPAWFWWQPRVGAPESNMQLAFLGHIVVLCDALTASDGEAFAEGIRRLGLGTIIGTRTWGGEIWLTSSNVLVDRGIATAAEFGVYGPEGEWLIEGHGVDPDIVVDNLPHATFNGRDAQLEAAVEHLLQRLEEEPVTVPPAPPYPDKSFGGNRRKN